MRSLMKNERAEPTPAVRYTKDMKLATSLGLVAEVMLKSRENPGSDGTTELEPWSHAWTSLDMDDLTGCHATDEDLLMHMPDMA